MRSQRVIFDVSDMVDMNLSCSSDESVGILPKLEA